MTDQIKHADAFAALHVKGDPLVLVNIWDAGSAKAVQDSGAKAIATGSWSVAAAHGFEDGEQLPVELALANLRRIVARVKLPVTIDIEGGYGETPAAVEDTVTKVIEAGAVGINLEDQLIGKSGRYSVEDQCARIGAARRAAESLSVPLFINARTDIYLQADPDSHSSEHHEEAMHRATAYTEAGASGFFAPGLADVQGTEKLCAHASIPVNIMVLPNTPSPTHLAGLGVARISYGPRPYQRAMNALMKTGLVAL